MSNEIEITMSPLCRVEKTGDYNYIFKLNPLLSKVDLEIENNSTIEYNLEEEAIADILKNGVINLKYLCTLLDQETLKELKKQIDSNL